MSPAASPAPARRRAATAPKPPATESISLARIEALEAEVAALRTQAELVTDLQRRVEALTRAWNGLAFEISDEMVCHDYEQLNHDSDQKVPEAGGVLVGWGFGAMHGDYRTFWRRHSLRKPDLDVD